LPTVNPLLAVLQEDECYEDEAGAPEMTPEQAAQMRSAVREVYATLGADCGIPLDKVEETLWYYYFDVAPSVDYLLKNLASKRRAAAKQEKKANKSKASPHDLS
ncbi:hypothetical protein L0F63_006880, partial [Massospora cicadina]